MPHFAEMLDDAIAEHVAKKSPSQCPTWLATTVMRLGLRPLLSALVRYSSFKEVKSEIDIWLAYSNKPLV